MTSVETDAEAGEGLGKVIDLLPLAEVQHAVLLFHLLRKQ